jgi:hypothetical protein
MPKTVAEVLTESGWTPEMIAALDAKANEGFTKILSTAEQMQEQAALTQRAINEKLANEINPALDKWATDEARLKAEAAFYREQAQAAKANGFIAADAPGFTGAPAHGADGKFVAGGNQVPGSPDFKAFSSQVGQAIGNLADLQWKYRTLYGSEMPESPTKLAEEATAQRMSILDYAAKKYNFAAKEQEISTRRSSRNATTRSAPKPLPNATSIGPKRVAITRWSDRLSLQSSRK